MWKIFSRITYWAPPLEKLSAFPTLAKFIKTNVIIEKSVKSGKHRTRTLSLVQNRMRCKKKNLRKIRLALRGGGETQKCTIFVPNWVSSGFDPLFPFPERLHGCYIYFHCSYMCNFYNYLEPCALNAEFEHFIPRFNKTSFLCRSHSKRG